MKLPIPSLSIEYLRNLNRKLEQIIIRLDNEHAKKTGGVVYVDSFTVATVPDATAAGLIYVSDETGGAVLAFSDGTNWRRVTDRAVVS